MHVRSLLFSLVLSLFLAAPAFGDLGLDGLRSDFNQLTPSQKAEVALQIAGMADAGVNIPAEQVPSLTELVRANAPEITSRINAALDQVGEYIQAGGDLVASQTPLLIQEILHWAVITHGLWFLVGVILLLCPLFIRRYLRRANHVVEGRRSFYGALHYSDFDGLVSLVLFGGIAAPVIGFLIAMGNIGGFLKPLIAPRVYLIEYFSQLVASK